MGLTFPFEEVEGAQEAAGRGDAGLRLSDQLCKLVPGQVYEPGDVAEHQVCESLRVFVPQPLDEEVRVEDHRLAWLVLAGEHAAFRRPVDEKHAGRRRRYVNVHITGRCRLATVANADKSDDEQHDSVLNNESNRH